MTLVQIENVRHLSLEAARRGWLATSDLWEVAYRYGRSKGTASTAKLFEHFLSPEQIALLRGDEEETLTRPIEANNTSNQNIAEEEIPPTIILTKKKESAPKENDLIQAESLETNQSVLADNTSYELGPILGRGGAGIVHSALDRRVGRTVALKILRKDKESDQDTLSRFLREARLTAQLEHPGVLAVYDIGTFDRRPFYTMPVIKQRSLQSVFRESSLQSAWPLSRLCSVFVQICQTMAYVHERGVIHRDLKPANILLGDFGEVYVADWGLAKLIEQENTDPDLFSLEQAEETQEGTILGTPGYMSPEQARGQWNLLNHKSDLFSLGVIFYEMLCGQKPFQGSNPVNILLSTMDQTPKRPRSVVANCPLELEDLCLRLLQKDPLSRPISAEAVAIELESFLEGSREMQKRREKAKDLAKSAAEPAVRYRTLGTARKNFLDQARQLLDQLSPWDPIEQKHPAWHLEHEAKEAETSQALALAEAVELYSQALGYDPECLEARKGLSDLYWSRAAQAKEEKREATQVFYESLVKEYDDGPYTEILNATASLSLQSNPPGAEVFASQYQEKDRLFVLGEKRYLGKTPLQEVNIAPGSYLLEIKHPAYREVRYPIFCQRTSVHEGKINLYTEKQLGKEFVYVPAGAFLFGGDPDSLSGLPREEIVLPDFAIQRLPITFSEYLVFLNELSQSKPEEAKKRLLSNERRSDIYVKRDHKGDWVPNKELLIEGEARRFCPEEKLGELPAISLDWFDALAYCRWRSKKDGGSYRLPSEAEYEKTARGVDGRFFPWGNHFDPTFCKMRDSRPGLAQPEPVGAFSLDKSPYGVYDLAGGIRIWMADIHGEISLESLSQEAEPALFSLRSEASPRMARGGSWLSPMGYCRVASRQGFFALNRYSSVGMRLLKPLIPSPSGE